MLRAQRFGPVEKGGMDEAFVDVTALVRRRLRSAAADGCWHGHVFSAAEAAPVVARNRHRPMDLRSESDAECAAAAAQPRASAERGSRLLLQVGGGSCGSA
jgi:hypothetical protein